MRIYNKAANEYYFVVKSMFSKMTFQEGRFLKEFKVGIIEYSLSHPKCTYDELCEEFGTPQEVYFEYMNMYEHEELIHSFRKTRRNKYIVRAIIIILLIFIIGYFTLLLNLQTRYINRIPTKLDIEILDNDIMMIGENEDED